MRRPKRSPIEGFCHRCRTRPVDGRKVCELCAAKTTEYRKKLRLQSRENGNCHRCGFQKADGGASCKKCRLKRARRRLNARLNTIHMYGGKCVCCGVINHKYMQLDHINGGGNDHRKERSDTLYVWASKNGYPPILQLLCASCHQAKTLFGGCTLEDHLSYKSLINAIK